MSNRQTKYNFYTNIVALAATFVVGIYYTPFLVKNLGLAAYGILPLALIINQYISVVTNSLTHSYTRFYSVALQCGDYDEASKTIFTSLVAIFALIVFTAPVGFLVVYKADAIFNIPERYIASAQLLSGFTILSFFCSLFSSLFNTTLYANNRLDLLNWLKIIRIVCKLVFVVGFFECLWIDVAFVGVANISVEIILLILSGIWFFQYKPKEVGISLSLYDKTILAAIVGMSGWVLLQV